MANSIIAWTNLSIGFSTPLLHAEDYALTPGQALVLLGPNGAGKSTFLKTICGLLAPISGSVSPNLESPKERSRQIAFVPQSESVEFGWTVRDFVALSRAARGGISESPSDRTAVDLAMEQCDVSRFADLPLAKLSGGEQQRARIARGLAQETPILAFDEPTSHLDIAHAIDVLHLIKTVIEGGKTVLLSLHDVNQALSLDCHYGFAINQKLTFQKKKPSPNELREVFGIEFEQLGDSVLPATYRRTTG